MGNSIAKDFHQVKLGRASVQDGLKADLIAPGSVVLENPMTVVIRKDHNRRSTIVFDMDTMLPLFVTRKRRTKKRRGEDYAEPESVTKDRDGNVLFLTTKPSNAQRMIYKAPKARRGSTSASSLISESIDDGGLDSSNHSSASVCSASSYSSSCSFQCRTTNDLPCAAQIDIDRSGSSTCAVFSVVVWKGNGPELMQVYKAVQIPTVKYGALVVDNDGQVVGKTSFDNERMEPVIKIAGGADVPSVVALSTALLGDF